MRPGAAAYSLGTPGSSGRMKSVNPQQEIEPRKPNVVIVDDDPAIRNSLAFLLKMEGLSVLAYASAAELLTNTSLDGTGCLVIDYKLPGMNGLDLLAELRRRHIAAPAILITTHPSAAVRERAAGAGTTLIEKPLLNDSLVQEIRSALAV
jgi:two-component system response regulator FixJ